MTLKWCGAISTLEPTPDTTCWMKRYTSVSVYKHAEKELGQYPAILNEQAWPKKELLYGIKHQNMINFPCGTKPVSQAGKIAPSYPLG